MVTLVKYGLGNIQAFHNIYSRLNLKVEIATTPKELLRARKIILPGVGAFDWAMTCLNESGLRQTLDDLVLKKQVPVLGICVGMQMMAKRSEEGFLPGLSWIDADVKRFDEVSYTHATHLPHMGWNDVMPVHNNGLFAGIMEPRFYFLHSYYFSPVNISQILARTDYGGQFPSAVSNGHIYGVQFHPEKSHEWGIQLLKNFAEL
jgi:imidazole glycerol-phosphate synthase subunit HisH